MIRAAYGLSVNRPEFRELAPFYFVDFDLNAGIYGNPAIKQAYIHNFDLRFEHYPSPNETFNIGVFYKHFITRLRWSLWATILPSILLRMCYLHIVMGLRLT